MTEPTTIPELSQAIVSANISFAQGMPFLTDEEYDILWHKLYVLDPTNKTLYHTTHDPNIQSYEYPHPIPILGTQKAIISDDLKPFLLRFPNTSLVLQPKYDGVGAVVYKTSIQGTYKLVMFGDGKKGRDISHHIDKIVLPTITSPITNVELIIPNNEWKDSYGKNPRNTVSGWLAKDKMDVYGKIYAIPHEIKYKQVSILSSVELAKLELRLLELYHRWKQTYPIDGIMIKLKSPAERLKASHNGTYSNWSIAWKPPISTATTTVTSVEFNISRSGRLIPKIKYAPIELCGTTNQFVTANNAQWFKDSLITIGDTITIGKAGEIIPQILHVKHTSKENFFLPMVCPICDTSLVWKDRDLICTGENCITKTIKQVAYFYSDKGMNLKSIGEAMIEELLHNSDLHTLLVDRPWALLDPIKYDIVGKLLSIWGQARVRIYNTELKAINGIKNPAHFVAAMGYKNLAYKRSLAYWQDFKAKRDFTKIPSTFLQALNKFLLAVAELNNFSFTPLPEVATMTYAITGKLDVPREELVQYLTKYGWSIHNQVSKRTNLLILGTSTHETTKLHKAKSLNIPIISEAQISNYIK